ncbi:carboxypeptidase regulatory-like domain-containing protein [Bremerella sp. JC817]|uniref:carboxypeptidase regulatory-like domain-containing protein n=1 Tax=Bremerella sp. JC817 TaxID=3231756 RepID=UPI0034583FAD
MRNLSYGLILAAMMLGSGCTSSVPSNVAEVTGLVTVDGKPAAEAMVSFSPTGGGRTSFGLTDDKGQYRLIYTNDIRGAIIGDHMVSISNTPPPGKPSPAVLVPAKFGKPGSLTANVEQGSRNEINFELVSK